MTKFGILIHQVSELSILKTILDVLDCSCTIIYEPEIESLDRDVLELNLERFKRLKIDKVLAPKNFGLEGVFSWEKGTQLELDREYKKPLFLGSSEKSGLETPMLDLAIEDGVFGRGYIAMLLEDYLEKAGSFDTLVFSKAYYTGLAPWAKDLGRRKNFTLVDPLYEYIKTLSKEEQTEDLPKYDFYWTSRDFEFERTTQEILQKKIEYKMWHKYAWLRY